MTQLLIGSDNTVNAAANENSATIDCRGHKVRFMVDTNAEVTVSLYVSTDGSNWVMHPLAYTASGTDAVGGGVIVSTSGWADTVDLTGFVYARLNVANATAGEATISASYAKWWGS